MVANAAVPASVAAAQASAPAASVPAVQQPTLISGARAATPAATAAPAATSAHQGGMPWDRGAAVPAAQPAPKSAAPAPAPKPVTPAPGHPLRLRLPRPLHRPRRRPSPTTPPRLPPPVLPRPLRSRMPESCSANGPRLSSVSRRVRLPTQGFCSTPAPRPTTAPNSRSRSPRVRLLPLRCSVAPIRSRWSCRRSARSSVVVPSTMSWMGVARRLLNMRSILHLHGLRHLRTRNPCPRRPLHSRAPARRSSKRHR